MILLVDDDAAHRKLIARAVRKAAQRIEIVEASNLDQADELLAQHWGALELVLLDLNLDGHCGLDLLIDRDRSKSLEPPVVIISTSTLYSDYQAAYAAGANAYVNKSHDTRSFLSAVEGMVRFFLK